MRYVTEHLHCGKVLLTSLNTELLELSDTLDSQPWAPDYSFTNSTSTFHHQAAYNKSLSVALTERGWLLQPRLSDSPRLIGDFSKGLIFDEIQFGNSATLYRDFYKFQFGLHSGLLSLAVLIVPYNEYNFFPTRPKSVQNMANFKLALRYFTVLPISVPTIIFGLLADDEEAPKQSVTSAS